MYAVIKHGGKQYKVHVGDVLELDRIEGVEPKETIEIDEVLLVKGDDTKIGTPKVEGAKVILEVINHARGKKVIIFSKKEEEKTLRKKEVLEETSQELELKKS